MATSYEIPGFKFTLVAGEDLSDNQYHFVTLNAAGEAVKVTAITDEPVGVQQGDAGAGEEVEVMATGVTKLEADSAVAIGDEIGTSADGQGDTIVSGTDTTVYKVGKALQAAGGAGVRFACLINCLAPSRAA